MRIIGMIVAGILIVFCIIFSVSVARHTEPIATGGVAKVVTVDSESPVAQVKVFHGQASTMEEEINTWLKRFRPQIREMEIAKSGTKEEIAVIIRYDVVF